MLTLNKCYKTSMAQMSYAVLVAPQQSCGQGFAIETFSDDECGSSIGNSTDLSTLSVSSCLTNMGCSTGVSLGTFQSLKLVKSSGSTSCGNAQVCHSPTEFGTSERAKHASHSACVSRKHTNDLNLYSFAKALD
jgi:hypothetical protein